MYCYDRLISVLEYDILLAVNIIITSFEWYKLYKKEQSDNLKLCDVRKSFDKYNLISGLHTLYSKENEIYKNILPPLRLLDSNEEKDLIENLKNLNFKLKSKMAAWYAISSIFK